MSKERKLKIKKITNKPNGLDVKGQGCHDDCKHYKWSGNRSAHISTLL